MVEGKEVVSETHDDWLLLSFAVDNVAPDGTVVKPLSNTVPAL